MQNWFRFKLNFKIENTKKGNALKFGNAKMILIKIYQKISN